MSNPKHLMNPQLKPVSFIGKFYTFMVSRKIGFKLFFAISKRAEGKITKGLENKEMTIKSKHGSHDIRIRIYRPENNTEKLPIFLYLHGGGYAVGSPEESDKTLKGFIDKRPCVIVAPGYRKSLEKPYPAAFDDCYDTLLWIKNNAEIFNGDASKIMIGGHSAGGGLTAAVTLKARDTGDVNIAFQMPFYPMIDDRHQTESSQFDSPVWGNKSNTLGWNYYLKDLHAQNKEIPGYAAPARNKDYSNFPPTLTFVGSIDPFRDETLEMVDGLKKSDIPVAFKIFEGCYHGFEVLDAKKQISKDAVEFQYQQYAKFYDDYIL